MTPSLAPRVSVVLPVFNAEAYLASAIESLLAQRFQDFELLIVDDGSTDRTAAIVRTYRDRRIRPVANPRNLGLTRTLNIALSLARGEYIARQDADDISEPERLAKQVAFLDRQPAVALAGSWFTAIDAAGAAVRRTALPVHDLDLRWAMFFSCPFVHSAVIWRREPVRAHVGGYDESIPYAEDYDLWSRIAARFSIANVPEYLVRYREHDASMTTTYGERTREGTRMRRSAIRDALGWQSPIEEQEARVRTMAALLRPSQLTDLTPDQARRATADLLALQAALCQRAATPADEARRHRRAVRSAISRGLVRVCARTADAGRFADARRMLAAAYAVYWPALARRSAAHLAARLLRPSRTVLQS